jgi:hypothetical protein
MKTLTEKEEQLLETVALPGVDDWQLLDPDDEDREEIEAIVAELNAVLVGALEFAKLEKTTFGEIGKRVYSQIDLIQAKYPERGVKDSEARQTVARFFAVNYSPVIYDFLRYYIEK